MQKKKHNTKRISKIKPNTPLEDSRAEAEAEWNEMVTYDYSFQKKANGLEYVDVKSNSSLSEKSLAYLEIFRSMSKEKKIEMLELEEYNSEEDRDMLKDENHFILHASDGSSEVIHKDWFKIDQDEWQNFDKRRIKEDTISKCYDHPNQIHKLDKHEIKWIRRAHDVMTKTSQIHKIKRLPDNYNDMIYYETEFDGKQIRTKVKYVGIDSQNKTCFLEDSWLKDNFDKPNDPRTWERIVNLKPNHVMDLKIGSSGNDPERLNIPMHHRGPLLKYTQGKEDTCLILSLANVMDYLRKEIIVENLLKLNKHVIQYSHDCRMKDIIDVMTNQKRKWGQKRITKLIVRKVRNLKTMNLINDRYSEKVYHCVLENHHSIALYSDWIFDPVFPYCLRRNEKNIRICAETFDDQDTKICIYYAYEYIFI